MICKTLYAEHAIEILCKQPKQLRMMLLAQHIHLTFGVALESLKLLTTLLRKSLPVGFSMEDGVIQKFIHQDRVAGQILGRPVTGGHHANHPSQGMRIFGKQSQISRAARDGVEKIQQAVECCRTGR